MCLSNWWSFWLQLSAESGVYVGYITSEVSYITFEDIKCLVTSCLYCVVAFMWISFTLHLAAYIQNCYFLFYLIIVTVLLAIFFVPLCIQYNVIANFCIDVSFTVNELSLLTHLVDSDCLGLCCQLLCKRIFILFLHFITVQQCRVQYCYRNSNHLTICHSVR